jgi:hypothetical protein
MLARAGGAALYVASRFNTSVQRVFTTMFAVSCCALVNPGATTSARTTTTGGQHSGKKKETTDFVRSIAKKQKTRNQNNEPNKDRPAQEEFHESVSEQ